MSVSKGITKVEIGYLPQLGVSEINYLLPVKIKIKGTQYARPFYLYEWRIYK